MGFLSPWVLGLSPGPGHVQWVLGLSPGFGRAKHKVIPSHPIPSLSPTPTSSAWCCVQSSSCWGLRTSGESGPPVGRGACFAVRPSAISSALRSNATRKWPMGISANLCPHSESRKRSQSPSGHSQASRLFIKGKRTVYAVP